MKVGFVTIIGRPNVGKSSLLNAILEYKVAITSDTPQTTRDQIKGIYNDQDSQIIFIDTPGIHKPKQKLGESLNEETYKALKDIDLVLFLQPINEEIGPGDKRIIDQIQKHKKAVVITKIDTSNQENVANRAKEFKRLGFEDVLATSTNIKQSIESILDYIKEHLEDGEPFYDREQVTDRSMRFLAKEIIRESAINFTKNEVPHSIGVIVDDFNEDANNNKFNISATIFVERDSQKGILIGKDGTMIKRIGVSARKKMAYSFNNPINLNLRIKVRKKWTSKPEEIVKMGY